MTMIIIAKTQEKLSYQDDSSWFTQYAIRTIDKENERYELSEKYGVREILAYSLPCVAIRRKVKIIDGLENPGNWEILDFGNGYYDTACRIGDSVYWESISLSPINAAIVKRSNRVHELTTKQTELEDNITPCKFQRQSNLQREFENRFIQELKNKKLYSKAQRGLVNKNVLATIKKPLQEEYNHELEKINNQIDEISRELELWNSDNWYELPELQKYLNNL